MIRITAILFAGLLGLAACQTGNTAMNDDIMMDDDGMSLANPTDGFERGEPDV